MKKLTIAAGFAAGYLLGARAGRQRYEQLVTTARSVVSNPKVQQTGDTITHQASDLMTKAKDKVSDKVNARRQGDDENENDPYASTSYDVVEVPERPRTSGNNSSGI